MSLNIFLSTLEDHETPLGRKLGSPKHVMGRHNMRCCGWTKSCTTLKPWDTIVRWYLQANHHSSVSQVVQDSSIHSMTHAESEHIVFVPRCGPSTVLRFCPQGSLGGDSFLLMGLRAARAGVLPFGPNGLLAVRRGKAVGSAHEIRHKDGVL